MLNRVDKTLLNSACCSVDMVVLPLDPATIPLAAFQLERRLKQGGKQPLGPVELPQYLGGIQTHQPLMADHPPHQHPGPLFHRGPQRIPGSKSPGFSGVPHPRLIVALVGPRSAQHDLLARVVTPGLHQLVHVDAVGRRPYTGSLSASIPREGNGSCRRISCSAVNTTAPSRITIGRLSLQPVTMSMATRQEKLCQTLNQLWLVMQQN